jgi:hypothetical protein
MFTFGDVDQTLLGVGQVGAHISRALVSITVLAGTSGLRTAA